MAIWKKTKKKKHRECDVRGCRGRNECSEDSGREESINLDISSSYRSMVSRVGHDVRIRKKKKGKKQSCNQKMYWSLQPSQIGFFWGLFFVSGCYLPDIPISNGLKYWYKKGPWRGNVQKRGWEWSGADFLGPRFLVFWCSLLLSVLPAPSRPPANTLFRIPAKCDCGCAGTISVTLGYFQLILVHDTPFHGDHIGKRTYNRERHTCCNELEWIVFPFRQKENHLCRFNCLFSADLNFRIWAMGGIGLTQVIHIILTPSCCIYSR